MEKVELECDGLEAEGPERRRSEISRRFLAKRMAASIPGSTGMRLILAMHFVGAGDSNIVRCSTCTVTRPTLFGPSLKLPGVAGAGRDVFGVWRSLVDVGDAE